MIHYSFIGYMIASAIIMIVSIVAYRVWLENKVLPMTNRLILLSIYAVSFLLPFLVAIIPASNIEAGVEIGKLEFGGMIRSVNGNQNGLSFQLSTILLWLSRIYFLGLFITFILSFLTVSHLIFILKKSKILEIAGIEVYIHDNKKCLLFHGAIKYFFMRNPLIQIIRFTNADFSREGSSR